MSQNIANTGLPTPTTTQDWTTVPDKAILSASKDDQATADVKYAEHQCQKQVRKECKVAEEMVAHERAEIEGWEQECWDQEEQSEMPVVDRPRVSVLVGDRPGISVLVLAESGGPGPAEGLKVKGKVKAHDPVLASLCAQCVRDGVECMSEESGGRGPGWVFEIQGSIDWHTSEMEKHWEIAKQTQHMQRQLNSHLYDLQETKYWQMAGVVESSDEASTGKETSDGETDKDVEGEEAPE
ncbi:hypothetical protein EDC04DRAFT_2610739 [Pisolithus marmoratus]|nr:hypothetical protein EDC04DRAFT_2610739 [Pisolithus marmoratus]